MVRPGSAHHKAVLSEDKVRDIRRRYHEGGVSQEYLAYEYEVCSETMRLAIRGATWRHVRDYLPYIPKPRYLTKLNPDKVREIRKRYAEGGISMETLAKEFGVRPSTVKDVLNRRSWKHVL